MTFGDLIRLIQHQHERTGRPPGGLGRPQNAIKRRLCRLAQRQAGHTVDGLDASFGFRAGKDPGHAKQRRQAKCYGKQHRLTAQPQRRQRDGRKKRQQLRPARLCADPVQTCPQGQAVTHD